MLSFQLFALSLASLVSAAIFPPDTQVKMLDAKGFKDVMKRNQTSMVAFVAPWCGHCQRMAPEYSRAAKGLYPLVPLYAVDCDEQANKRLCADQGVQGFPTIKLFPRGNQLGSMTYDSGERTANAFFYWASRRIPNTVTKLSKLEDISSWASKTLDKPRVLLLTKDKKIPLLWKVLGNKYKDQVELGIHRDDKGKTLEAMGYDAGGNKQGKILVYPVGSINSVRYEGLNKLGSLSKFFDAVLDGTADLKVVKEDSKAKTFVTDDAGMKRKQDGMVEEQKEQGEEAKHVPHMGHAEQVDLESKTETSVASSVCAGECVTPTTAPTGEGMPSAVKENTRHPTDEL